MGKFRFRPFSRYAEDTPVNLEKLNSIRSLYKGYQDSSLPVGDIAGEFYRAVGKVLMGLCLEDLNLEYLELEGAKREKELILSLPLLDEQIYDLLESNLREKSKAGLHNLLGTLRDYCEEEVKQINLLPVD